MTHPLYDGIEALIRVLGEYRKWRRRGKSMCRAWDLAWSYL
jgi:hypothetical protein